jgi:hypothetical protein
MLTEAFFFHLMLPRVTKKNLYICIFQNFSNKKLESSTPIILNDGKFIGAVILTFDRKCDSEKKHIKKYDKY